MWIRDVIEQPTKADDSSCGQVQGMYIFAEVEFAVPLI